MEKRKTMVFAGALLLMAACACDKGDRTVGAYGKSDKLGAEEDSLFRAAVLSCAGLRLKPLKVSRQVVAGTNFRYECVDENGRKVEVVVFQPLPYTGEEARVTSVGGKQYDK